MAKWDSEWLSARAGRAVPVAASRRASLAEADCQSRGSARRVELGQAPGRGLDRPRTQSVVLRALCGFKMSGVLRAVHADSGPDTCAGPIRVVFGRWQALLRSESRWAGLSQAATARRRRRGQAKSPLPSDCPRWLRVHPEPWGAMARGGSWSTARGMRAQRILPAPSLRGPGPGRSESGSGSLAPWHRDTRACSESLASCGPRPRGSACRCV